MIVPNNLDINFNTIPVSRFWSDKSENELRMHKIHWYPAKFPPFLVSKSLQYAQENDMNINNISFGDRRIMIFQILKKKEKKAFGEFLYKSKYLEECDRIEGTLAAVGVHL